MNATNTVVNYQVIGDTNQRTLAGGSDITLQNIATPVTVTCVREDNGLCYSQSSLTRIIRGDVR